MKKLILSLLIVASAFSVKAQSSNPFPTTDSLIKFINKWVRNSPIDAFSNLRLNTAMIGITRFLQDSYGGKITGMAIVGDSLKITTTDGQFAVYLSSGGGGTNLTFTRNGTTVTVISSNGTDAVLPGATQNNAGVLTAADKIRIDSSVQLAGLRDSLLQYLRIADTAQMLAGYLNKDDTVSLSNRINQRQPAGNYITDLNGDVLATGPVGGGSANAVLSNTTVIPGEYLNANITVDSKGRITSATNGTGGGSGTDNTNLGTGFKWLNTTTQGIKTVESTATLLWDSTTNTLRARVDTSAGRIATKSDLLAYQPLLGFTPENVANKSTNVSLGTSNSLYPTQNAVKTYVDNIAVTKQDLLGYTPENIANKSTNTSLGNSNTLYPTQNAVKVYVDNQISGITFPTVDATLIDGSTNAIQNNAVYDAFQLKANINSPTFTGVPAAPTPSSGDSTTKLATTAFVKQIAAGFSGSAGEVNTASNVGSGTGLYKEKIAADLRFKSLTQGAFIGLTNNTNDVQIRLDSTGLFTSYQAAINARQPIITLGSTSQYFRGDLSLATFPTNLSEFTNGPGYITASSSNTLTNKIWNGSPIGLSYIAQGGATLNQVLKWNGTSWAPGTDNEGEGGGETSELVGTANRITVSGTTTTQIDIASNYAGQTSINTVGTINNPAAIWQGTKIAPAYGGVPTGGSIGWILAKTSNADNAVGWIPAPTSTMYYPGTGILIDGENNISIDPGYDFGGVTPGNKVDINVVDANTYNINSGVVSNTKLANMAGNTIKGRLSSTGVPQDLTGTQVTSLLDQFSTSTKGLVPAASGGNLTEHFLRKDGTWALPPSADTVSLSNRINQKLNPADTVNLRISIDRKARVFNVLDYGATGDGVQGRSNVTSGSATITCGSCSFTSADIGKVIKVSRGGASARDHVTTIASINSSTSIQMTSVAANTVTNAEFDYGTDQTAAIQAAANAAHAAGGGDVYIPSGIYILNGPLQTSVSGANPNCQIYIPYESNTSINRTNIRFLGEIAPQFSPWGLYEDTHPTHKGTVLLSTIRGSGTAPGVFGSAGAAASYYFNYNYSAFKNLTILVLSDPGNGGPSMGGLSMSHGGPFNVDNVLAAIDGSALHSAEPIHEVAGFIPNTKNGETMSQISNSMVGGFRYGILTGDHTVLNQAQAFWCWAAIVPTENFQPAYGGRVLIHFSKHGIYVPNTSILGIPAGKTYFKFDEAHIEVFNDLGWWWDYESCIKDDGNLGVADVTYGLSEAFVGYNESGSLFVKQGGTGIKARQIGSGGTGGGSGDLQSVTDEGNTTSNGIVLDNTGGLVGGLSVLSSSASSFASVGFRNNANHLAQMYLTGTSHATPATLGYYNNGPGGISFLADVPSDGDSADIRFYSGATYPVPVTATINGSGLLLAGGKYLNYGTVRGTSGYGIRDNAGTMQFKNSGGSWTNFGSGGSGSDLQAVTTAGNTTTNGMVITNTGGLAGGVSILSSSASSYASLGYRNDQNDLGQIFMNGSSNPVSSIITNRSMGIYTDGTGGMGFSAERANATIRFGTGTSADLRLTINDNGLLQPASGYHNYGTTAGSTGYGFRDNAGTMEYKNSGGSWTTFAGGGGGSQDLQSVTNIGNTTDDGLIISNAGGMNNGFKVTATGSTSYASLSMLNNLGNTAQVGLTGSSFSASGGFTQEGLFVYNGAPGGVSLIADNATAGFRVTTGGQTVRFAIGSSGGIQTPGLTSGYLKVDGSGNWSVDAGTGGGMTNPMTTSQDIIVGGSSGTPTRLGAGSDGQVLKMVSGSVQWATDATGGGGSPTWGSITGTLSSQTDLQSAFDLKAPLATPTFTGSITTPRIITNAGSPSGVDGPNLDATVSISGNDVAGRITVTVNSVTSLPTLEEYATITFAVPYASQPRIVFSPGNAAAAGLPGMYLKNPTVNNFSIARAGSGSSVATTYIWDYMVVQ